MQHSEVSVEQRHLWMAFREWTIAVIVCGLLFGLDRIGTLGWFKGGVEQGVLVIDTRATFIRWWFTAPMRWLAQSRETSERLASLEQRLAHAAVDQQKVHTLESQIDILNQLSVQNSGGKKASHIAALVDYGDRIMLTSGVGDGMQLGQIVTDKEGVVVGRVATVGRYMSDVTLLDEVGSRVQVQTINGKSKGIIEGKGGNAELVGVLQTELLGIGDVLVTSGADGNFPPGLVVGQVVALVGKPEDVTKGAVVDLLATHEGWVAVW